MSGFQRQGRHRLHHARSAVSMCLRRGGGGESRLLRRVEGFVYICAHLLGERGGGEGWERGNQKKNITFGAEVSYICSFYKIILTTSAASSTYVGSILIFATCVLHRSPVTSKFHGSQPNVRLSSMHYITFFFFFLSSGGWGKRKL